MPHWLSVQTIAVQSSDMIKMLHLKLTATPSRAALFRCTKHGLFLTNVSSVVLAVFPAPVWEVEEVEEVEESKKFHDAIRLRAKSKKIFVKRILRVFKWRSLLGNVAKCLLRINQK